MNKIVQLTGQILWATIASFVAPPLLFVLCPQLATHDVTLIFFFDTYLDVSTYVHYKFTLHNL